MTNETLSHTPEVAKAIDLCNRHGVEFWALGPAHQRFVWGVRDGEYVTVRTNSVHRYKAEEKAKKAGTYTHKYGTLEVGKAELLECGYIRIDRWIPDDGDSPYLESCHAASKYDVSDRHLTYPTGYDSRCGWCYLGATHTEDLHQASKG